jgi:hypothetical protein
MRALRVEVLQNVPDELDASVGPDDPVAIVMDIGMPEAVASVFSGVTGDASIYLSSGGGLLGGIEHENVRMAAVAFVQQAAKYRHEMVRVSEYPYPADGNVRFYVRTREAVYATPERSEDGLENKQDALWPLFYAGQNVITQLQAVAPNFGQ